MDIQIKFQYARAEFERLEKKVRDKAQELNKETVSALERATKADPGEVELWLVLGQILAELEFRPHNMAVFAETIDVFKHAATLRPLDSNIPLRIYRQYYIRAGRVRLEGKMDMSRQLMEEGLPYLKEAVRLNETLPELHVEYGDGLRMLGYEDQARSAYQRALELDGEVTQEGRHMTDDQKKACREFIFSE